MVVWLGGSAPDPPPPKVGCLPAACGAQGQGLLPWTAPIPREPWEPLGTLPLWTPFGPFWAPVRPCLGPLGLGPCLTMFSVRALYQVQLLLSRVTVVIQCNLFFPHLLVPTVKSSPHWELNKV